MLLRKLTLKLSKFIDWKFCGRSVVNGEHIRKLFSTLKIILDIPLPRFKRKPSVIAFAYSLYGVLFLTCSQMATDLENFQAKIYTFKINFLNTISLYMELFY